MVMGINGNRRFGGTAGISKGVVEETGTTVRAASGEDFLPQARSTFNLLLHHE